MTPDGRRPPRLGEKLFSFLYKDDLLQEKLGDLEELFSIRTQKWGKIRASLWYFSLIFRLFLSGLQCSIYWSLNMFKNYLTTSWRNLKKHKGYSLINILGLSIGLASFMLIFTWVLHELNYDRFHEKADNIYRVVEKRNFPDMVKYSVWTPGLLAGELKKSYPEVLEAVRTGWTGRRIIRAEKMKFYENGILTVDPSFFRVFDFPFIQGDPDTALQDPFSAVITETTAKKYFGEESPIGKSLNLDNKYDLTVTGIIHNAPSASHIQFDIVVPFYMVRKLGWKTDVWDFSMASTYVLLEKKTPLQEFENKIAGVVKNHNPDSNTTLFLQPLTRIWLFSSFAENGEESRIFYVSLFSFVVLLILFMACVNFTNLTTARAETRAKEIGLRKVLGAERKQLIKQFLTESVFFAFAALLCASFLIGLFLPKFNKITGEIFSVSDFFNIKMILWISIAALFTGIFSGSYPSLVLSALRPSNILKSPETTGIRRNLMRRILVITQTSISLILIIVSIFIYRQVHFLKSKDLGFDKDHVLTIPLGISNTTNSSIYKALKKELSQYQGVQSISASFSYPTSFATPASDVFFKGKKLDAVVPLGITSFDFDFIETMKIPIVEGRSFSRLFGDERGHLIVNKAFEKFLGVDSAVGEVLHIGENYQGMIIGVTDDFHLESVAGSLISPLIMFCNPNINTIVIRTNPENIKNTLAIIEESWQNLFPHLPFSFNFLDEEFSALYKSIENLGVTLTYFTILAVMIACLGLLGLAAFSAQKRTKEIGIRKVLGCSVPKLVFFLCRDFLTPVLLANIVAWPAAWIFLRKWLQNYPYRVEISLFTFFLAGVLAAAAAFLTVSIQTVKAATADPVRSLRYE
ncbi:MAG: ABC transporter permease [Candidatus Aminicenantes bacterium]|nr:ABC transporter permease [Candidatus Aminicenantes bacterium]